MEAAYPPGLAGDLAKLSSWPKVELVERLLERGVLHDEKRAITQNWQIGKCCYTGCTTQGQPVMVALPASRQSDTATQTTASAARDGEGNFRSR